MIPSFVFSTFIYGFVIQKIISSDIFSNKNFFKVKKILVITFLLIFFIFALNLISPVIEWLNSDSKFKNPFEFTQRYPLDKEGLTSDSIILNTSGSWVVDYSATPLYPFLGYSLKGEIDETKFPQKPIKLLKELLETDHDIYIFKKSHHNVDKIYLNYLVNNHELILKEYSKTFCKIELKEQDNVTTDQTCLQD